MNEAEKQPAEKKSPQKKSAAPKSQDTVDEQTIVDYLNKHPDFFQRHSTLVSELKIPHGERGSISLVERQLEVQRERHRRLQAELKQLIDNADANQSAYDRIAVLAIAMAKADSLESLLQSLCDQLADSFAVDAVAIELPAQAEKSWPDMVHTLDKTAADSLPDSIKNPYLGSPPEHLNLGDLFGERADEVASVAILPLSSLENGGRLLLASFDSERFRADLGTSLLVQIAELFTALLCRHWPDGD